MMKPEDGFTLPLKWQIPDARQYTFAFLTLFIFLIIIYANSFKGAFHFDDYPNIIDNPMLQMRTLSWESVKTSFYGADSSMEKIQRPLSYLTLALNYYFGGTDPFGYHVVNFIIHYIASIFLFLLLYHTLKLPILKDRYRNGAYAISLLGAFFWATHPIQVTAVTYIVQRMASMAAMFYLMGMYFYVRGRMSGAVRGRIFYFTLSGIAGILSVASKQNGAMLPVSIFFYDLFLIQGVTKENIRRNLRWFAIPLLILLLIGILHTDPTKILKGYEQRPFTLGERLLTQPRILLDYLGLLIYPTSDRLALMHDPEISRSLFVPWTTLPSILLLLIFAGLAVGLAKKRPLISYCILFFFLNHLIEGSFIGLELFYEHRNYLPSAFFFTMVAVGIFQAFKYFLKNRFVFVLLFLTVSFLLSGQAHTTYLYNAIMENGIFLWSDALKIAPDSKRVHLNLGVELMRVDQKGDALRHLEIAYDSNQGQNRMTDLLPAYNMGHYYLTEGNYIEAEDLLKEVIRIDPSFQAGWSELAMSVFRQGRLNEAEKYIRIALSPPPNQPAEAANYHQQLSLLLLYQGKTEEALKEAIKADFLSNETSPALLYSFGEIYRLTGKLKNAVPYYKMLLRKQPYDLDAIIAMIDIFDQLNDSKNLKYYVYLLMALKKDQHLDEVLEKQILHPNIQKDKLRKIVTKIINSEATSPVSNP